MSWPADRWDVAVPETVDDVVALLRRRIEVHAWWRDNSTPESESAGIGTPESHQAYIDQYEGAINVILGGAELTFDDLVLQLIADLNQAHDEICKLQGLTEDLSDWPEWSPQANTIRQAEKLFGRKLAKTDAWTLFPSRLDGAGAAISGIASAVTVSRLFRESDSEK